MSKLHFRTANSKDLPSIQKLVNSAYRGESSKRGWTTEADLLDGQRIDEGKLAEMIAPDESGDPQQIEAGFIFDAADARLAACMHLRFEKPASAYVGMLTVDPGLQQGGYGKQLLDHAEEIARKHGCTQMRMTVIHLRKELIDYYLRRGYHLTGASEPFPSEDPRFGIPRVQGMTLVELTKPLPSSS